MYNHLIPNEHIEAIGDVVVSVNLLEWNLIGLIQTLSKAPELELRAIMAEMSLPKLKDFAVLLGKLNEPKMEARISETIKRFQKIEDERNDVVHSVWMATPSVPREVKTAKWTAKAGKGLKLKYISRPLFETLRIAKDARSLAEDLMELRHDIRKSREKNE